MHLYKIFLHMSLPSADRKCQNSYRQSKNGSELTILCAPKVLQEVNFPKSFLSSCIQDRLQLCTYVSIFSVTSDGATTERQIQNRVLWSISYQFDEGQRRQLCIDLDAVFAVCQRTRCAQQRIKRFVVPSIGGATRFTNLRGKFSKTQKSAAELCQIIRMVTVEIVINYTS